MKLSLFLLLDLAFGVKFFISPGTKKCLKEEIHKDVVVTGDFSFTPSPKHRVSLSISSRTKTAIKVLAWLGLSFWDYVTKSEIVMITLSMVHGKITKFYRLTFVWLIQRNMFFTIRKEPANKKTKRENSLLQQTTKMFLKFVSNPKALAVSQMVSFQHS